MQRHLTLLKFPMLSDFTTRQVSKDYGVLPVDRGIANRSPLEVNKDGRIQHIEEGSAVIEHQAGAANACSRLAKTP